MPLTSTNHPSSQVQQWPELDGISSSGY